jgi:hypothetical protein
VAGGAELTLGLTNYLMYTTDHRLLPNAFWRSSAIDVEESNLRSQSSATLSRPIAVRSRFQHNVSQPASVPFPSSAGGPQRSRLVASGFPLSLAAKIR